MSWNRVAVVGAGLIKFGELHQQSFEQMAAGALESALASVDKGMSRSALDFAVVATQRTTLWGHESISGNTLPSVLGLNGIACTRIENACPTGSDAFRIGAMAVASGVYDCVLVIGVEKMRDKSPDEGLLSRAATGQRFRYGTVVGAADDAVGLPAVLRERQHDALADRRQPETDEHHPLAPHEAGLVHDAAVPWECKMVDLRRVEILHPHAAQRLAEGAVDLLAGQAPDEGVARPVVFPGPDVSQGSSDLDRIDVPPSRHAPAATHRLPVTGQHPQVL